MCEGLIIIKKLYLLIALLVLLVGCNSAEKEKERTREEAFGNINDNMDNELAGGSLTDIWHIEDHVKDNEELDEERLFRFTDKYIMDMDNFNDLNGYEQGLVMKTSTIITKSIKGKYEDVELFDKDIEEYYDILKNGDETFTGEK